MYTNVHLCVQQFENACMCACMFADMYVRIYEITYASTEACTCDLRMCVRACVYALRKNLLRTKGWLSFVFAVNAIQPHRQQLAGTDGVG